MRIAYIANIRLPTEKAHGIQIMEMCAAFADEGCAVELVVPKRRNSIVEDPFMYHDVAPTFSLRRLYALDLVRFGRIGFLLSLLSFTLATLIYALSRRDALFYTRDELIALSLRMIGRKVVWEGHTGQRNLAVRALILLSVPIVVITEALAELYASFGVDRAQMLVAPDAADLSRFAIPIGRDDARKALGLPLDASIALYKGHLYEWKGAHTLARAAGHLLDPRVLCVFIGGTEGDLAAFRKEFGDIDNIRILGNRPRKETPIYQRAADVLVIPNSAKDDVSKHYTSPMKLFGYMASGVPIVASDLPSLREIVDDRTVAFFRPDDPVDLARAIRETLDDVTIAKRRAEAAYAIASEHSWQRRARRIMDHVRIC